MSTKGIKIKKSNTFRFSLYFFCFLNFHFLMPADLNAFEVKGLQPLQPYGVFSTFSTESLKKNNFGIGFQIERSFDPDFYRTILQIAYGLSNNVELNLTIPYILDWEDKFDGFEDASIGLKHRLIEETKTIPAVGYILTASIPSGRDYFSTDGRLGIGLLVSKKIGPFKGHSNLFYSNPGKSEMKDEYSLNLGAELAVSHNSKILGEVIGKKDYFKSSINFLEWRMGYRVEVEDNIYTTIGAGFDIKRRKPDFRLMFSISMILPKEKQIIQKIYE